MTAEKPPIIFLMGPTAAGKTDLALSLCDHLNCEIISVDSALVYRDMNIGTAKPDAETLARYPHRLVDFLDPSESYSAAEFRRDALSHIEQIHQAGKVPLLVGGTMMYYNALVKGLADLPEADEALRAQLLEDAKLNGWPALHARLAEVDPESAARLAPNDSQRLQRAMEVYLLTGIPLTEHWRRQQQFELPYKVTSLAVAPQDRAVLHQRIAKRFEIMLEMGFIAEVEALYKRGDLNAQMPSMRSVGYRQVWSMLEGEWDYQTMIDKGIVATRQLAKRQLTWLRGWESLHWLDGQSPDLLTSTLKLLDSVSIYE